MTMLNIGILVVGVILITSGVQGKTPKQVFTDALSGKLTADMPKSTTGLDGSSFDIPQSTDPGGMTSPNMPTAGGTGNGSSSW
jgi:hypothetical protein